MIKVDVMMCSLEYEIIVTHHRYDIVRNARCSILGSVIYIFFFLLFFRFHDPVTRSNERSSRGDDMAVKNKNKNKENRKTRIEQHHGDIYKQLKQSKYMHINLNQSQSVFNGRDTRWHPWDVHASDVKLDFFFPPLHSHRTDWDRFHIIR